MKTRWFREGRTRLLAVAAVAALLPLAACGSGSDDDGTITLRLAHYKPTTHQITVDGIDVWMKEVEERTDGKVKFDYYPAGQLVGAEEIYSSLQSGAIDIASFVPAVSAGADLPLTDVPTVPGFELENGQVAQAAYWDLLNGALYEEEWKKEEIRPLMGVVTGLYQFVTSDKPRYSLADWKGSTVRSSGGVIDFVIKGMGGAPVNIPGPEEYEALQRKTVDSAINTIESIPVYDFNEVLKAGTTNAPIGASLDVMAISDDAWDELPEDVQTAMKEASEVAQDSVSESLAKHRVAAEEETKGDVEYYELSAENIAELEPVLADAQQSWLKQKADEGIDGQKMLDAWNAALEKARTES